MIQLFRPLGIHARDFQAYAHCWRRFGERNNEAVVVSQPTEHDFRQAWDRVNCTNGTRIVWSMPHFMPLPSFFDELDYLRGEGQLIVLLRRYDAVFELGQDRPCEWRENGISRALVVFQLSGQNDWVLPPARKIDTWKWLSRTHNGRVYHVPQRYSGDPTKGPAMRSNLGVVVGECWGSYLGAFGRTVDGVGLEHTRSLRYWRDLIEGWEMWLR